MSASGVEILGSEQRKELTEFLLRDPIGNLYLLGLIEEFGVAPEPGAPAFSFRGFWRDGALQSAVFVGGEGGLVIPCAAPQAALANLADAMADPVHLKAILGEPAAVDLFARRLAPSEPSVVRTHRLFAVSADELGPFTNPALRLAREDELDELTALSAAAVRESLERDPLEEDPQGFRERIRQRILGKRTYVLKEDDRLIFKIDVGPRSRYGAELETPYTLPEYRRRGHATHTLGQISRHLLSSIPRLTLRIDERISWFFNAARKVGYVSDRPQKLILARES